MAYDFECRLSEKRLAAIEAEAKKTEDSVWGEWEFEKDKVPEPCWRSGNSIAFGKSPPRPWPGDEVQVWHREWI